MTTVIRSFPGVALRAGIGVTLAVSGLIHADLYIHGYRQIPVIGTAFALQGAALCALAVLIALGGPWWMWCAGALLSAGTLVGFVLSRTVGVFGFAETGWNPAPQALISVVAELLTVTLVALTAGRALGRRRHLRPPAQPLLSTR